MIVFARPSVFARRQALETKCRVARHQRSPVGAENEGRQRPQSSLGDSPQVMGLLPLDPLLPVAPPPERRAALELRMAQLRAAPPLGKGEPFPRPLPLSILLLSTSNPVSEELGKATTQLDVGEEFMSFSECSTDRNVARGAHPCGRSRLHDTRSVPAVQAGRSPAQGWSASATRGYFSSASVAGATHAPFRS